MEPTYFAQYRGFAFHCSPQRIGSNEFAPRLVIYDSAESLSMEIPMSAPTPSFTDPTAAAHQAFAHGRLWVDSSFDAADMAASASAPLLLEQSPPLLPG